jgi:hypothetical protein
MGAVMWRRWRSGSQAGAGDADDPAPKAASQDPAAGINHLRNYLAERRSRTEQEAAAQDAAAKHEEEMIARCVAAWGEIGARVDEAIELVRSEIFADGLRLATGRKGDDGVELYLRDVEQDRAEVTAIDIRVEPDDLNDTAVLSLRETALTSCDRRPLLLALDATAQDIAGCIASIVTRALEQRDADLP